MAYTAEYSLFDGFGQRKYLNRSEGQRFKACALESPREVRLFCLMVYYTGARISEIADLNVSNIDFCNRTVIIRTLKKREKGIFRQLQLPDFLVEELKSYIGSRRPHRLYNQDRLWFFSTRTGSRYIKAVMNRAGIDGHKASARGLRHGFAACAVLTVPVTQVKVWLGHASLKTTLIYVQVSGMEDRELAERLWDVW